MAVAKITSSGVDYPIASGKVEAAGAKSLCEKDATFLGSDFIHSLVNPIDRLSAAIHVYGDDYFNTNRKEWDPETLLERPCDVNRLARLIDSTAVVTEST